MSSKIGIDLSVVAGVAVNVWVDEEERREKVSSTRRKVRTNENERLTSRSLSRNRSQLHSQRMSRFLEVTNSMPVSSNSTELSSTATERSTGEAEPEVLVEVAARAGSA